MNMFTSSLSRVLQDASPVDASDVAESAEKRARRERIMAAMRPKACVATPKATSKPTAVQRSPTSPIKFSPDDEEFMLTHVSSAGVSSAEARANICLRARKPRMVDYHLLTVQTRLTCLTDLRDDSSIHLAILENNAAIQRLACSIPL